MPSDVVEDLVDHDSERRPADYIVATMSPVVDVAVAEVVDTVISDSGIAWRKNVDAVAEVVRIMSPEAADMFVHDEVSLPWVDSHDIMAVHPVVVIIVIVVRVVVHEAVVDVSVLRRSHVPVILLLG